MKKCMYVFGSIEIICGLLLLATVDIMKSIFPLVGRVTFQLAMKGSFFPDDYAFFAPTVITIGVVFLVIGAIQLIVAFRHKEKE